MDSYDGFREFVSGRIGMLSRIAYLLTGDHHAAQDLLQAALAKTAARWERVAALGDPEAYVRKVMYHQHISWWRRRRRITEHPVAELPDRAAVGDADETTVRRLVMERALARLTPRQRAVVVLRYYEDRSEAETAALLGISTGTVKSQLHRALTRLREGAPELADLVSRVEVLA